MSGSIGRFNIIKEIGRGGVGRVYRATDPLLKRDVALKVLLSGEFADETELGRFQREVESCAKLRHPNIVPLYEVGKEEGKGIYMVMEFIQGITLQDYIRNYNVVPLSAAQITCILAKAVHYAHEEGIIHRDIKPQNIIMRDNKIPMLTDFGLARKLDKEAKDRLTRTGDFVGTPGYMAPEQINGDIPSRQMDVYALGCVFYELLTGVPPYQGESIEIVYHILDENDFPPTPRQRKPEIAKDIDLICQKAMNKDLSKRYQTLFDFAEDIELYLQGKPIKARPMNIFEKGYRWCKKHKAIALSIILCISCLAFVFSILYVNDRWETYKKIESYLTKGKTAFAKLQKSNENLLEKNS